MTKAPCTEPLEPHHAHLEGLLSQLGSTPAAKEEEAPPPPPPPMAATAAADAVVVPMDIRRSRRR